MRHFHSWPRWALVALRALLIRVPVMPGTLMRIELEIWSRDVIEWADDESMPGYPCAPVKGVN